MIKRDEITDQEIKEAGLAIAWLFFDWIESESDHPIDKTMAGCVKDLIDSQPENSLTLFQHSLNIRRGV